MGSETSTLASDDKWSLLARRIKRPCKQWTFYVVMFIGILFLGYLSVWIELKNVQAPYTPTSLSALSLAYATATLAVVAPSAMQLILTSNRMAVLSGFVIAVIAATCAYIVSNSPVGLSSVNFYGIVGLLLATFSWWLANGDDDLFQDKVVKNSATGGDAMRELPGNDRGVRF